MARTLRVEIIGDASSLSRAFAQASSGATAFGRRMEAAGASMAATGASLTRHLTLPLAAVGVASVKLAADFEESMTKIETLVGVNQATVDAWSKDILDLAPKVGKAPQELADALFFVTSAGFRGAEAIDILTMSAKASAAGLGETKVVADAVTSALNAYKGTGLSAAKATDILIATVKAGKMPADELAGSLGRVIPVAAAMGVSFDQVGAAMAAMTRVGLDSAQAATALRGILGAFLKPSKGAAEAMKDIGTSADQVRESIATKGLMPTLIELGTKLKGNAAAWAKLTPNVRALVGELILVGKNAKDNAQIFKDVANSAGLTDKAFERTTKESAFKFNQMMAALKVALISLGQVLEPVAVQLAGYVTRLAMAFKDLDPATKTLIAKIAAIAAIVGPTILVFGKLTQAVGTLMTALITLATNPLVLVVAAIAAFAAAVALAVLAPDKLRSALERMGLSAETSGRIVDALRTVFDTLKMAVQVAADWIRAHWDTISEVFRRVADVIKSVTMAVVGVVRDNWTRISDIVKGALDIVATVVRSVFNNILSIWRTYHNEITTVLKGAWEFVKNTIRNALQVIRGVINVFAGLLHGDWSRVWKGLGQIFGGIWGQITNILSTAWLGIKVLGSGAAHFVAHSFTQAWNALKGALSGIWSAIGSALQTVWDNMKKAAMYAALGIIEPFTHLPSEIDLGFATVPVPGVKALQEWKRTLEGEIAKIDGVGAMKKVVGGVSDVITSASGSVAEAAAVLGTSTAGEFGRTIGPMSMQATTATAKTSAEVRRGLSGIPPTARKHGTDTATGFGAGLGSIVGKTTSTVGQAAGAVARGLTPAPSAAKTKGTETATGFTTGLGSIVSKTTSTVGQAAGAVSRGLSTTPTAAKGKGTETAGAFSTGLQGIVAKTTTSVAGAVGAVTKGLSPVPGAAKAQGAQAATQLGSSLAKMPLVVAAVVTTTAAIFAAGLGGIASVAYTIGSQISSSLAAGIYSQIPAITAAATAAARAAEAATRAATGVHSESPKYHEIGKAIVDSIRTGMMSAQAALAAVAGTVMGGLFTVIYNQMKAGGVKTQQAMRQAMQQTLQVQPEVERLGRVIGVAHARAIAIGAVNEVNQTYAQRMIAAIRQKTQEIISAAAQKVRDSQSAFASAFSDLASAALAAFDAKVAAWVAPAQKILDKMDLTEFKNQLGSMFGDTALFALNQMTLAFQQGAIGLGEQWAKDLIAQMNAAIATAKAALASAEAEAASAASGVSAAQAALDAAQASGDQAAIDAAQAALDAANKRKEEADKELEATKQHLAELEQARKDALARIAAAETEAHTKKAERDRIAFEKELTAAGTNQKKILAVLKKYVPEYLAHGKAINDAIALGLQQSLKKVNTAVDDIVDAIGRLKKLKAELNVTVTVTTDGGGKQFGGDVLANVPYIVGEAGPELFVPTVPGRIIPNNQLAASGVGGTTASEPAVHIHIHGGTFVGTNLDQAARELAPALAEVYRRSNRTLGGNGF